MEQLFRELLANNLRHTHNPDSEGYPTCLGDYLLSRQHDLQSVCQSQAERNNRQGRVRMAAACRGKRVLEDPNCTAAIFVGSELDTPKPEVRSDDSGLSEDVLAHSLAMKNLSVTQLIVSET